MSLTLNFRSFHHNFLNAVLTGACLVLAGLNLKLATHTLEQKDLQVAQLLETSIHQREV
ncbi:rCG24255 [Rattus norvegicus]|uniref:RCG24255 n=1 Tax=Rattus norvegicus TaxID=10116 RepID=A6KAM0_RAT|nr:rCG24255 [Rattus norvegicus]